MQDAYKLLPMRVDEFGALLAKKLAADALSAVADIHPALLSPPPTPPPAQPPSEVTVGGLEVQQDEEKRLPPMDMQPPAAREQGRDSMDGSGEVSDSMRKKTETLETLRRELEQAEAEQTVAEVVVESTAPRSTSRPPLVDAAASPYVQAPVELEGMIPELREKAEALRLQLRQAETEAVQQERYELRRYAVENKSLSAQLAQERERVAELERRLAVSEKSLAEERSLGRAMLLQLRLAAHRPSSATPGARPKTVPPPTPPPAPQSAQPPAVAVLPLAPTSPPTAQSPMYRAPDTSPTPVQTPTLLAVGPAGKFADTPAVSTEQTSTPASALVATPSTGGE